MAERQNKVKKYRKPLNLNIGMLIFGAIFIYVIICVIMYFQTDHIVRYEVTEGSLATNNIYKGIAIRKEEVVSTDTAGYVNFYAREGERVAKGDTVYIVDETGRLSQELEEASLGENTLNNQELSEFRNEIVNFMHGYDDVTYESTYDFKYSLKNTVLKLANVNMLQSIKNENGGSTANIVNFCYAPTTGIVAYWTDGYEGLTVEGVTEAVFDHKDYEKKQMLGNELMAVGDPVYKLSTDENWSVVIPIDAERGAQIQQEDYARVAYEDFFEKYNMDDTSDEQLTGLKDACKVEAKRRDDQMLAYLLYQKKSAADELFDTLNDYLLKAEKSLDGVDLKELTENLGKLGSLNKEEITKKTAELIAVDFKKNKGGDGTDGGEK